MAMKVQPSITYPASLQVKRRTACHSRICTIRAGQATECQEGMAFNTLAFNTVAFNILAE
ncbi:hypothetical protein [Shewanella marisflavi]|uniref:hypothetical protein n=1 Tax=Shewanella marisflavi TaxID=260364 RepID=UPI003AB01847